MDALLKIDYMFLIAGLILLFYRRHYFLRQSQSKTLCHRHFLGDLRPGFFEWRPLAASLCGHFGGDVGFDCGLELGR